jgi:hypothetical protein
MGDAEAIEIEPLAGVHRDALVFMAAFVNTLPMID